MVMSVLLSPLYLDYRLLLCDGASGSRETVVDFTAPYYMESTTLVSGAPKEKSRTFAVFSPFTLEVSNWAR